MSEWINQEIEKMMLLNVDYKDYAVLMSLKIYIEQLEHRIEQYENEIDGKMWQPSTW